MPAGGRHRPAVLLPVLACIVLGVLCSVASMIVAVLIPDGGQHAPRTSARHDLAADQAAYIFTARRPGYLLMTVSGPMERSTADALDSFQSQRIPLRPGDPRPAWLRRSAIEQPQTSRGVAAGWPLLSFWGRTDTNVNLDPQRVDTGVAWVQVGKARRAFPWRPIWRGLALNTLAYGAMLLAVWFALLYAWRLWRRKRRRCPACAYPIEPTANQCPECGRPYGRADRAVSSR
ncbi:MAG: zinc ribbon domain-containing protein [Phycisphaerales bacterium]